MALSQSPRGCPSPQPLSTHRAGLQLPRVHLPTHPVSWSPRCPYPAPRPVLRLRLLGLLLFTHQKAAPGRPEGGRSGQGWGCSLPAPSGGSCQQSHSHPTPHTPACCDTTPLDPFFQGRVLRKAHGTRACARCSKRKANSQHMGVLEPGKFY